MLCNTVMHCVHRPVIVDYTFCSRFSGRIFMFSEYSSCSQVHVVYALSHQAFLELIPFGQILLLGSVV